MKKITKKIIEMKSKGWEPIPASYTEDECFIILWFEKKAGAECDHDPFGNAIPGTTRNRYIRKEICYDKWTDTIEEVRI